MTLLIPGIESAKLGSISLAHLIRPGSNFRGFGSAVTPASNWFTVALANQSASRWNYTRLLPHGSRQMTSVQLVCNVVYISLAEPDRDYVKFNHFSLNISISCRHNACSSVIVFISEGRLSVCWLNQDEKPNSLRISLACGVAKHRHGTFFQAGFKKF